MDVVVVMVAASAAVLPQTAAAAMLFAAGMACFGIVRRVCRRPRRRQRLRRCPLCASAAVGVVEHEVVDELRVRVLQRCGQCGVWRATVTALSVVRRYERALEADRIQILRSAEQLERARMQVETDALLAVIRDGVVGAEDLLALISADTSTRGDQSR